MFFQEIAVLLFEVAPATVSSSGTPLTDQRQKCDRYCFVINFRPASFPCDQPEPARESRHGLAERITSEHFEAEPDMVRMTKHCRIERSGLQREQLVSCSRLAVRS